MHTRKRISQFIVSVRFKLEEIDRLAESRK